MTQDPTPTELTDADLDQVQGGDKKATPKTPPPPKPVVLKDIEANESLGNFEIQ